MSRAFNARDPRLLRNVPLVLLANALLLSPIALVTADELTDQNWFQWRGPLGTGVALNADPPIEWNETKNIRWKVALPGKGHSTPIVWGDRVFVTAAIPYGDELEPRYSGRPGAHDNLPVKQHHRFEVLAIDRRTGKILWQKTVREARPHEGGHYTASLASSSPVTDGGSVFAFFGSYGLSCLDMNGNVQWQADLGDMHSKHGHGEGSSPVLHGDTLVVNWDHEEQSFLVAFDKRTGRPRWKVTREEVTSWATPIVVEHNGDPQLVVSGTGRVRGYDLSTGKVIWECGGLSANIVATPVAADGMVFAGSSYEKRAMLAIRHEGAKGDIAETKHVAWTRMTGTPYVPSPLLYGNSLYFLRHYQGILSRVNSKTGKDDGGPFRLGAIRDVYASPVAAANRIYITDRDGRTQVITHSDHPDVLAVNQLNDSFSASAAIVNNELFLRGERYLYCIAEK
ncbi:MAG: PQQ-like beta-propeller repeat protein [Planctomycetes bacterium]|nr:PQQ-like beta-propeller repeat protein [Planctomycetota bacterium]